MPLEAFVYGGLSAIVAELVSFPFDTSKIRQQVQGQVTDVAFTDVKYRGTWHTMRLVSLEEGFRSLFNGFRFAALRQATYGTLRFGIFFTGKSIWNSRGGSDKNLPFLCSLGMSAGVIGSLITTPIDRMKVVSQSEAQMNKRGIMSSFRRTYSKGGFSGLYQGKWPNAKRAAVVNGVEIPCYVFIKSYLTQEMGFKDNLSTQAVSAIITSGVGIACSQPFDVAKTRIMQQKTHRTDIRVYKGFGDMMRLTIENEGFRALWKGSRAAWFRNGPWNVTFYLMLESCRNFDQHLNHRDHSYF